MIITNKLLELIEQGGYAFMIPLIIMSLLSVAVILERYFALRRDKILSEDLEGTLDNHSGNWPQTDSDCLTGHIIRDAHLMLNKSSADITPEISLQRSAEQHLPYLTRRMWMLNAIGNLAPLLGLLGTVVGLAISFEEIGTSGMSQEGVASGIGIALITTITGLTIAIPTLFAHYGLKAQGERQYQRIKAALNHLLLSTRQGKAEINE